MIAAALFDFIMKDFHLGSFGLGFLSGIIFILIGVIADDYRRKNREYLLMELEERLKGKGR